MSLFFELDFETHTTKAVLNEITDPDQFSLVVGFVNQEKIFVDSFYNDDYVFQLAMANPGLSLTDCTTVDLAQRKQAILLSSDKSLRKVSERQGIEVHGVLWIIESLFTTEVINNDEALKFLDKYRSINPRAPLHQIKELTEKFS